MKNKEELWKDIFSFVGEYFPDCFGVMVTGSFLSEHFNDTSDIDITILSGLFRKVFIDTYNYHGTKMQVVVFPVYDLKSVVTRDIENGGVYLYQLHTGRIIKDSNHLFRDFKNYAESVYISRT